MWLHLRSTSRHLLVLPCHSLRTCSCHTFSVAGPSFPQRIQIMLAEQKHQQLKHVQHRFSLLLMCSFCILVITCRFARYEGGIYCILVNIPYTVGQLLDVCHCHQVVRRRKPIGSRAVLPVYIRLVRSDDQGWSQCRVFSTALRDYIHHTPAFCLLTIARLQLFKSRSYTRCSKKVSS